MNNAQRIFKNIGITGISQIITSVLAFLLLIYLARYLGAADFGTYNFAMSFTSLFIIIADIGISQFLIREIARNKEKTGSYVFNAFIIKIVLSFVAMGLIILVINLIDYPKNFIDVVYLFGIYTILSSFTQLFIAIFNGYEKMEFTAVITTIEKFLIFFLSLIIIYLNYGLVQLSYIYVLTGIIVLLFSMVLYLRIGKPNLKINLLLCKNIIINSVSFGLNGLFSIIFLRIDTILLQLLQNSIAVGIYSAAYNPLLSLGIILSNVVGSAIFPVLSRYYIDSKESLEKFTKMTSKYMIIIGLPIAVGSFILADRFIDLLYGGQFIQAVLPFQILSLFIPIRLVSTVTGTLLSSIDKQGLKTFGFSLGAVFNIILNILLIPYISFLGASIATVLSELFIYIIFLYFVKKSYKKLDIKKLYLKPLIASSFMGIIIFYLKSFNIALIIIIAILLYFILLILLKTFSDDDKYLIKQIFPIFNKFF